MNAYNPLAFAASFVDFKVDTDGVEVSGDKIEFSLIQSYDSDICINAVVTGTKKTNHASILPKGKTSPEDEVEHPYQCLEVSNISICKVTFADGVEVLLGMPFILTDKQIGVLNGDLLDIALDQFEREIESFEPDFCMECE